MNDQGSGDADGSRASARAMYRVLGDSVTVTVDARHARAASSGTHLGIEHLTKEDYRAMRKADPVMQGMDPRLVYADEVIDWRPLDTRRTQDLVDEAVRQYRFEENLEAPTSEEEDMKMLGQTYGKWEAAISNRLPGTKVQRSHRRRARAIEKRRWKKEV